MNDTKHETKPNASPTPGPWVHGDNGLIYGQCTSEEENESPFVCDVISDEAMRALGILSPQEEANARLIEAAPRLLAELEKNERILTEYVEWHHRHQGGCSVEWEERLESTRAVLAEAKGLAA